MPEVILKGWRSNLQKVSLTKLLQQQGGLDLKTAKAYTDRCLGGETVRIHMPSVATAEALALEISKHGAVADVDVVPQAG